MVVKGGCTSTAHWYEVGRFTCEVRCCGQEPAWLWCRELACCEQRSARCIQHSFSQCVQPSPAVRKLESLQPSEHTVYDAVLGLLEARKQLASLALEEPGVAPPHCVLHLAVPPCAMLGTVWGAHPCGYSSCACFFCVHLHRARERVLYTTQHAPSSASR